MLSDNLLCSPRVGIARPSQDVGQLAKWYYNQREVSKLVQESYAFTIYISLVRLVHQLSLINATLETLQRFGSILKTDVLRDTHIQECINAGSLAGAHTVLAHR
jgi:hypothetical protein